MSEGKVFLLILGAIYLSECLVMVRGGQWAALRFFGRRWLVFRPPALSGASGTGIAFANPLPPLGTAYLCETWPAALSPEGAVSADGGKSVPADRIVSVVARDRDVIVNGAEFVRAGSPVMAERMAGLISGLGRTPAGERAALISGALAEAMDSAAVAARVAEFEGKARWLRIWSNVIVLSLFVLCPLLAVTAGIYTTWPLVLLGIIAGMAGTGTCFRRAARGLGIGGQVGPDAWLVTLVPTTAMRAPDLLARPLLADRHPLGVAAALLPAGEFAALAAGWLRRFRYPVRDPRRWTDPAGDAIRDWFLARHREAVEALVRLVGGDPDGLAETPPLRDSGALAWCPRCHAQFMTVQEECGECPGVALRKFGGEPGA